MLFCSVCFGEGFIAYSADVKSDGDYCRGVVVILASPSSLGGLSAANCCQLLLTWPGRVSIQVNGMGRCPRAQVVWTLTTVTELTSLFLSDFPSLPHFHSVSSFNMATDQESSAHPSSTMSFEKLPAEQSSGLAVDEEIAANAGDSAAAADAPERKLRGIQVTIQNTFVPLSKLIMLNSGFWW